MTPCDHLAAAVREWLDCECAVMPDVDCECRVKLILALQLYEQDGDLLDS